MGASQDFLQLVVRLSTSEINRSEADLSSSLKNALTEFGLHGVLDTGAGAIRAKRPDIALYAELASADAGWAADVVVEAKKPHEVSHFPTLVAALIDDGLWCDKFVPYVQAHAERVQYFIFTTFEQFLIVPIEEEVRRGVSNPTAYVDGVSRRSAVRGATLFNLRHIGQDSSLIAWWALHFTPTALRPPNLSSILDLRVLDGADDLEQFAGDLADVVVGPEGASPGSTFAGSVVLEASTVEQLPAETRRALMIYTMSAHGGMSLQDAERHLSSHLAEEVSEFLSASIHSLIGRLFAVKTIEDCFCVNVDPPLVPLALWVFHSTQFDVTPDRELAKQIFDALARLGETGNLAVRDLAATGRFYDWLAPQVDPVVFRRLIQLFFSHSFRVLDGDLLGRFFEIYAQRVDRRGRRELGQYWPVRLRGTEKRRKAAIPQ